MTGCVERELRLPFTPVTGSPMTIGTTSHEAFSIRLTCRGNFTLTADGHTFSVDTSTGIATLNGVDTEFLLPHEIAADVDVEVELYVTPNYAIGMAGQSSGITPVSAQISDQAKTANGPITIEVDVDPTTYIGFGGDYFERTVQYDGYSGSPTRDCSALTLLEERAGYNLAGKFFDYVKKFHPSYLGASTTEREVAAFSTTEVWASDTYKYVPFSVPAYSKPLTPNTWTSDTINSTVPANGGIMSICARETPAGGGLYDYDIKNSDLGIVQYAVRANHSSGTPYPKPQITTELVRWHRFSTLPNCRYTETLVTDIASDGTTTGTVIGAMACFDASSGEIRVDF
ncbi:hypothetical protein [Crateriforma conspicua]|uniref:hypothetical protein n=1 Tax=Crateriforma TaxID=2714592 RepID=UPI0011B5B179|nr:hypothetical protein [Crateriforma conspicua]